MEPHDYTRLALDFKLSCHCER